MLGRLGASVIDVLFSTVIGGTSALGLEKPSIYKVNNRNFHRKEIKSILNRSSSLGLAIRVAIIYFKVLVITAQSVKIKAYNRLYKLFTLVK